MEGFEIRYGSIIEGVGRFLVKRSFSANGMLIYKAKSCVFSFVALCERGVFAPTSKEVDGSKESGFASMKREVLFSLLVNSDHRRYNCLSYPGF